MHRVTLENLEVRTMMSVTLAPAIVKTLAVGVRTPQASTPALTLADRQELLNNWVGSNAATLASLLGAGNTAGFDAELLSYMRNRTNRQYYFHPDDAGGILNLINSDGGLVSQKNLRISYADKVLQHLFPEVSNSSNYNVQLPAGTIDWINQPATTTNTEFRQALNRHSFWIELAMSYRFTGNASYVNELKTQLESWSKQYTRLANPDDWIKDTVRPKWDLYVTSERLKNWMYAYHMLVDTGGWDAYSNTLFLHRTLVQMDFMARTTKTYEYTNNKATGHATALYDVALLLPELKNSGTWFNLGNTRMFAALDAQFRVDGIHYEQSPTYHGGAMNSFVDAYQLAGLNGIVWSSKSARRLRSIIDAYYQLLSPDGTLPALSDSYRSQGVTFFTGASLTFNNPAWPRSRPRLDDIWNFGVAATQPLLGGKTYADLTDRGLAAQYTTSGYYVSRSGADKDARQLIFDAGPKGGNHGHFDLLNFELYGYQHPLIADPGLLSYSQSYASQRAYVISTPAHNTISIDGVSHAATEKSTATRLDTWINKEAGLQVAATHYAYQGMKGGPVVGRNIWHDHGDLVLVTDYTASASAHTFTQSFNLFTTNNTGYTGGRIRTTTGNGDVMLIPILLNGQTVSTSSTILSNTAPDAGTTTGTRVAISQNTRYAFFSTLIVTYDNGVVPDVSAQWLRLPRGTRAGQIQITKDGVQTTVYVAMPDLSRISNPYSVKAPTNVTAVPAPALPFSRTAVKDEDAVFAG